ncbi:hypothetical protein D9M68_554400 [compost metagenome]
MAAGIARRPDALPCTCIDDVQGIAHGVGRLRADVVLLGVIAASEDQHIGNGPVHIDPGLDRDRPGLPKAFEAWRHATLD